MRDPVIMHNLTTSDSYVLPVLLNHLILRADVEYIYV